MYKLKKVYIRKQTNNRLPSPQTAAGEGASLHTAASGSAGLRSRPRHCTYSYITNIFLDIQLAMNLKTGRGHSINMAVL